MKLEDIRRVRAQKFKNEIDDKIIDMIDKENMGISLEELGITLEDLNNSEYIYDITDDDKKSDKKSNNFSVMEEFKILSLYKYVSDAYGSSNIGNNTRDFCRMLVSRTNLSLMTKANIQSLNSANPGLGKGGSDTYSIFNWRGGSHCKHYWVKYFYDTKSKNIVKSPTNQQPIQRNKGNV